MAEPHTIDYVTPGRFFCLLQLPPSNHYLRTFSNIFPKSTRKMCPCTTGHPCLYYWLRVSVGSIGSYPCSLLDPLLFLMTLSTKYMLVQEVFLGTLQGTKVRSKCQKALKLY